MKPRPRLSVQIVLHDCDDRPFQVWRGPVVNLQNDHKLGAVTESLSEALTRHGVEIPLAIPGHD